MEMEELLKIYESVYTQRKKRYPFGFWHSEDAKEKGMILLRFIVNELKLTEHEIQEISQRQLTFDFKLDGLYRIYNRDILQILKDAFPNIEFTKFCLRESFRKKKSETTKNLSQEKWDRIIHGMRHKRNTPEYRKKLSDGKLGELNYSAILTAPKIIEIRQKWGTGNYSAQVLGEQYGVKRQTINDVVFGRTWKHV